MDAPPTDDGAAPPADVQLSFANERTFLAWERTAEIARPGSPESATGTQTDAATQTA